MSTALTPSKTGPLGLFEGLGVELEYMIVDQGSFEVAPLADRLLAEVGGPGTSELQRGAIGWSNELTLHLLELKTAGPAAGPEGLADAFRFQLHDAELLALAHGARLLGSSMHPWMDPERDTLLWPHENNEIYRAYDRIFGVRGHGWANLQSCHINLPFQGDEEFVRLHSAIRVLLPLLPALAASSPVIGGQLSGLLDTRLHYYGQLQQRVPSISGRIVPELVLSIEEYHSRILGIMYRDIAPLDPQGVLQHEWLNSRGAIARFDRNAIEIRLLDVQETPRADLAIVALVVATLRALVEERWASLEALQRQPGNLLERMLASAIRDGERSMVHNRDYLALFGLPERTPMRMGELWAQLERSLIEPEQAAREGWGGVYRTLFTEGCLARRLLRDLNGRSDHESLLRSYRRLADCLVSGELFHARER